MFFRACKQWEKQDDHKLLLDQLLAVLHRDGGQYTALAGYAVAVIDAMNNYYNLREEVERLRHQLKVRRG